MVCWGSCAPPSGEELPWSSFVHMELEPLHSPTPNWEQFPRNMTHCLSVVS